jgi:hypothetical protein
MKRCEKCNQKLPTDRYALGIWRLNERTGEWHIRLAPGIAMNVSKGRGASEGYFFIRFGSGWTSQIETDDVEQAKRIAVTVAINLTREALARARAVKPA